MHIGLTRGIGAVATGFITARCHGVSLVRPLDRRGSIASRGRTAGGARTPDRHGGFGKSDPCATGLLRECSDTIDQRKRRQKGLHSAEPISFWRLPSLITGTASWIAPKCMRRRSRASDWGQQSGTDIARRRIGRVPPGAADPGIDGRCRSIDDISGCREFWKRTSSALGHGHVPRRVGFGPQAVRSRRMARAASEQPARARVRRGPRRSQFPNPRHKAEQAAVTH